MVEKSNLNWDQSENEPYRIGKNIPQELQKSTFALPFPNNPQMALEEDYQDYEGSRSSSSKNMNYSAQYKSVSAENYPKFIQEHLELEDGQFLENNQILLKIIFDSAQIEEFRIDEKEIDGNPLCYNYFFLHSGIARFIETQCDQNKLLNKSSLDFCIQQRMNRQQFIYQLKIGETLTDDQQRIFLINQSIESFKLKYANENMLERYWPSIKPQYIEQDVSKNLKGMIPSNYAEKIIFYQLKSNTAKEITTKLSKSLVIGDRFLKKPLLNEYMSKLRKIQIVMDLIFEHQMIQSLAYLDGKQNITTNDLFIVSNGDVELYDYCCLHNKYFVMQRDNNFNINRMESSRFQSLKQLELQTFMLLHYMHSLNKKGLYHGDLKPQNVFFDSYRRGFVTTDSGTIVNTSGGAKDYYRYFYTKFCSQMNAQKIINKEPFSIQELKEEDIFQFASTISQAYKNYIPTHENSKTIDLILALCSEHKSDIQAISSLVLTNAKIVLELIEFLRMLDNFPRFTCTFWGFFANCLDHSFASLQIPHADFIEKLHYDSNNEEYYISINYFYIMDEIAAISMKTYGEKDITRTRDALLSYLQQHHKPYLWYSIILRLIDSLHELNLLHKDEVKAKEKRNIIENQYSESLNQFDEITDPAIKQKECEAMVDCIVHLYSNFQEAVIGFHNGKHPAYLLFDDLCSTTLFKLVKDMDRRSELENCIDDQILFFRNDGIFK
ncbi:hypothetical protein FGO68_gene5085 [Halteria grandinella]|uniref:Uncharacterized protein n=1 Tax=Halteria grandinella TaxID=5974 RepID=A0A8J8NWM2_HALGN|nr:hypothetical protein FGO68_gene5085 [Halteria grandinella]